MWSELVFYILKITTCVRASYWLDSAIQNLQPAECVLHDSSAANGLLTVDPAIFLVLRLKLMVFEVLFLGVKQMNNAKRAWRGRASVFVC